MKIIYKDLLGFFKNKPSKEALSEKLFQLGHEHDFEKKILELELTPNRGDCLSLIGLARELNVFFEMDLDLSLYTGNIELLELDFINLSPGDCPKISFLEIEINEPATKYCDYLESHFQDLGINKNNFFTDISNYISYEMGQPTHCFDSKKLNGTLTFEKRECNEEFETLLGKKISLKGKNCVFSNDNRVVSLAGIMGGKNTACSSKTNKALVECAFFDPESIIGKSVSYNLQSDAAHKFERGVDIECQESVLRRFIKIVQDHVEIKSLKLCTFETKPFKNKDLSLDIDKINSILGTNISEDLFKTSLKKIGFKIDSKISVPSYRNDISSQNDLAEEIARIIGYNNIENKEANFKKEVRNDNKILEKKLRSLLIKEGFYEVINFPFSPCQGSNSIPLDNPLDSNKNFLRKNLKESLIKNLEFNQKRQKDSIKLFEISDIYSISETIRKELKLGIIASGRIGHNHKSFSKKIDRSYLEELIKNVMFVDNVICEEIPFKDLNTKVKDKVFYYEINLEDVSLIKTEEYDEINNIENLIFNKYKEISEFPSSNRDFSFSIKSLEKYDDVISTIDKMKHKNLKEHYIFDFYKNEKVREIKLGIRLVFQAKEKTLSEKEIQKSANELIQPILDLEGVSVPGI